MTRGTPASKNVGIMEDAKISKDVAAQFIAESRRYLSADYLPKVERCLDALTDEDLWWRSGEESNSIGNLLLHLDGSTRMWVISGAGGAPDRRDRQSEFDAREGVSRAELLARLRATVAEADEVLARVAHDTLLEQRHIGDYDVTVLGAILHAVEHFAMHAGQIIMLAKMRTGEDLRLSD